MKTKATEFIGKNVYVKIDRPIGYIFSKLWFCSKYN